MNNNYYYGCTKVCLSFFFHTVQFKGVSAHSNPIVNEYDVPIIQPPIKNTTSPNTSEFAIDSNQKPTAADAKGFKKGSVLGRPMAKVPPKPPRAGVQYVNEEKLQGALQPLFIKLEELSADVRQLKIEVSELKLVKEAVEPNMRVKQSTSLGSEGMYIVINWCINNCY